MLTIGEAIQNARLKKGYSIGQLAKKTQLTYQALYCWETNKASPTIINLIPVADALNISLDELVGRTVADR